MKRWQVITAILLSPLMLLLAAGLAMAQDQAFEQLVNQVSIVTVKSGSLLDALLGYWVQGNALTTPGGYLVGALAQIVVNTTHFFAELVTLF